MARRTQQMQADEWGMPLGTLKRYITRGAPTGNDKKFYSWLLNLQRVPTWAKTSAKMKAMGYDPKSKAKRRREAKKGKGLDTAADFREHYRKKLAEATEREGDTEGVKFWSDLFLKQDESIRRSEAHAAKLGIDNGTTLPRAEVERILRATFYAGNACVNSSLTMICQHIAGLSKPADIYNVLKPAMVGGRLFSGFDKVANIKGAPNLPDWVIECVRLEAKQYLSGSEALWTKKK